MTIIRTHVRLRKLKLDVCSDKHGTLTAHNALNTPSYQQLASGWFFIQKKRVDQKVVSWHRFGTSCSENKKA